MAMPAQPHTPPAPSPATIACPHCGGQCTASARFCGHCRQPIVTPPTNWAGVARTALIAGAALIATTCVAGAIAAAFWFRPTTLPGPGWESPQGDAGIEAGTTPPGPRTDNGDAGVGGSAVINGPLVVNNNGVPVAAQPVCCVETVDITRRVIPFRGPKARWDRDAYLRTHPFPSN